MSKYVCMVFYRDDKVYCCRSIADPTLWEFPTGPLTHSGLYASKMASLKEEILGKFDIDLGMYYKHDDRSPIEMEATICFATSSIITLKHRREGRWLSLAEIDSVRWAPTYRPIAEELKWMLTKQRYKITRESVGGSEDVVFSEVCSYIRMQQQYSRFINEQRAYCRAHGTAWRAIYVYNQWGDCIASEKQG